MLSIQYFSLQETVVKVQKHWSASPVLCGSAVDQSILQRLRKKKRGGKNEQ